MWEMEGGGAVGGGWEWETLGEGGEIEGGGEVEVVVVGGGVGMEGVEVERWTGGGMGEVGDTGGTGDIGGEVDGRKDEEVEGEDFRAGNPTSSPFLMRLYQAPQLRGQGVILYWDQWDSGTR
ncbi:unnamed protein product [Boreogadus saida]